MFGDPVRHIGAFVPGVKTAVRRTHLDAVREVVEHCLELGSAQEVKDYLDRTLGGAALAN